MNINDIKAAAPGTVLWDDKVRGLHLRVFQNSRAFYVYFRIKGAGRERRPKIGDWPTFDLNQAREIAREYIRDASLGMDPVAKRNTEANKPSMAELAERYVERHGHTKKTLAEDRWKIDTMILPRLGKRQVADITYTDIEDFHVFITKNRGPILANRVLSLLSKMFSLAEKWEYRPRNSNPCRGVTRNKESQRKRYAKPEELAAVFELLDKYKDKYPRQVLFIWLLILTGARPREIAYMKRHQRVSPNRIELGEHKTDGVSATRTVYLPPQAQELLDALPEMNGYITGIKSPRYLWRIIKKETGISDLNLYDLRHSFASAGLAAGLSLAQIGELLGHKNAQTTKRYAHLMDEAGVSAATAAADYLETMARKAEPIRNVSAPINCEKESVPLSPETKRRSRWEG